MTHLSDRDRDVGREGIARARRVLEGKSEPSEPLVVSLPPLVVDEFDGLVEPLPDDDPWADRADLR